MHARAAAVGGGSGGRGRDRGEDLGRQLPASLWGEILSPLVQRATEVPRGSRVTDVCPMGAPGRAGCPGGAERLVRASGITEIPEAFRAPAVFLVVGGTPALEESRVSATCVLQCGVRRGPALLRG